MYITSSGPFLWFLIYSLVKTPFPSFPETTLPLTRHDVLVYQDITHVPLGQSRAHIYARTGIIDIGFLLLKTFYDFVTKVFVVHTPIHATVGVLVVVKHAFVSTGTVSVGQFLRGPVAASAVSASGQIKCHPGRTFDWLLRGFISVTASSRSIITATAGAIVSVVVSGGWLLA